MGAVWKYGDDVRYAYAAGRIRALETKLLPEERIDMMAVVGEIDELMRLLGETPYADSFSGLGSPWEYDAILENEMRKVMEIAIELSIDPALTSLFRLRYDFHNLKVALKEGSGGESLDSAYVPLGTTPVEVIREAVWKNEWSPNISPPLRGSLEAVRRAFPETPDPKWIDILIDRWMFRIFLEVAAREKCLFLYELFTEEIDLINILTLFRIRWEDGERSFFGEALLEGGTLSRDFLLDVFEENVDAIPSRFTHTPYARMVAEGLPQLKAQGSFIVLERMKGDFLCASIRRADLVAFGIEPLIAYLYKKENELRSLRTIFSGLLNKIPPEWIKERILRGFF